MDDVHQVSVRNMLLYYLVQCTLFLEGCEQGGGAAVGYGLRGHEPDTGINKS